MMKSTEAPQQARRHDEQSLREDIAYFEARLEEMGYNGDCAYERAIAKTFARLVEERRASLSQLHGVGRMALS